MPWCGAGLAALALAIVPRTARSQSLDAAAEAFNAQWRVYAQGTAFEQKGLMVGGSGGVRLGRIRIGVGGWMGTLKGEGSAASPDVKTRTTAASVLVRVLPRLDLGAQYEVRRFETALGATVWTMMGASVRLMPNLGVPGLDGMVDVSLLPSASIADGPKVSMALQTNVGVTYAPQGGRVSFRLAYRFERYDVGAVGGAGAHYEQFRGVAAGVGIRFGR